MKTYNTPSLLAHGSLVAATATFGFDGQGDPSNPVIYRVFPLGSTGFSL